MPSREWDAEAYHRISEPQFEWGLKVVGRLKLRGDETVLDAGCGSGRLTAELLARLPQGRVLGADLSLNMLRAAREHLEPRYGGRVRFLCADLTALPLQAAADGVFSTAVFHWIPDHPKLFSSLFAALKPGGWLEAQCGGAGNLERLRSRAQQLMRSAEFAPHFQGFEDNREYASPQLTVERLRAAGFEAAEAWLEPAPATFPTRERFREFIGKVNLHKYVARLEDGALSERFLDAMAEQAESDNPPFTLDYLRMNLRARKPG
jgi:trans-aconitate methyltransferase